MNIRINLKSLLLLGASAISLWQVTSLAFDAADRQRDNEATRQAFGEIPVGIKHSDIEVPAPWGKIPVRVYAPEGKGPFPAMLHYHGGGWVSGNNYATDGWMAGQVQRVGMIVVSVDYRLAPEHPFPASLDDCYRALQWVTDNAARLNIDPKRIGIMGGSAGGNLVAAVALKARDEGGPPVVFQDLTVPAMDLSDTREWPSFQEAGEKYDLKVSEIHKYIDLYVPHPKDRLNPYASPLLAADFHGLPPALIVVAQFDPLRDQGVAYGEALWKAGVPATVHIVPGVSHSINADPIRAREAKDLEAAVLHAVFYGQ